MSTVALLTDFGTRDGYVAEMKGVLVGMNPEASIIDLTHDIPAQDIRHGAWVLERVVGRFPADTIHVAVVDPGVGTTRRPMVVQHETGIYIGPDNGLLSAVLSGNGVSSVCDISNPDIVANVVSQTFHGRDVFAPAAAHASLGADPKTFGIPVSDPIILDRWETEVTSEGVTGAVVHVDGFGNAITNIEKRLLDGRQVDRVAVGGSEFLCVLDTYADVTEGEGVVLVGSQNTLEISVNGGDASKALGIERGMVVTVGFHPADVNRPSAS